MDNRLPQGSIPEMRETGRSIVARLDSSLKSTSRDEGQFSRQIISCFFWYNFLAVSDTLRWKCFI